MKAGTVALSRRWLYLLAFAATSFGCCLAALIAIQLFQQRLPAPRLSTNPAFNEKIRWLKSHTGNGCDILILGSSMGLNNMDGLDIANSLPGATVVNAGSWGMSIADLDKMLAVMLTRCTPKVIVFAVFLGDFTNAWNKDIEWNEVDKYLSSPGGALWTYLENMDLFYYARTFLSQHFFNPVTANTKYSALDFDRTGGVLFEGYGFEIDPGRWAGYRDFYWGNAAAINQQMQSFNDILQQASDIGAKVIVVSMPMRPVAREALEKPTAKGVWEAVRATVDSRHDLFIDANTLELDDSNFTDFAHLNHVGAAKLASALVVPALSQLSGK
jgi:hypothetical protein